MTFPRRALATVVLATAALLTACGSDSPTQSPGQDVTTTTVKAMVDGTSTTEAMMDEPTTVAAMEDGTASTEAMMEEPTTVAAMDDTATTGG